MTEAEERISSLSPQFFGSPALEAHPVAGALDWRIREEKRRREEKRKEKSKREKRG